MEITPEDAARYGLRVSRGEYLCDQCGRKICKGDYYYHRYTNPAIHCSECRIYNREKWAKNHNNYNSSADDITKQLDINGYVEPYLITGLDGSSKVQLNRILKRINDRGYIIVPSNSIEVDGSLQAGYYWILRYSPIVQSFLEDLLLIDDNYHSVIKRYQNNCFVISKIIHEITGYGIIMPNSEHGLELYIETLMKEGIEEVSNAIYAGRISFDDDVYNQIMSDNRILVMDYFIEELFKLSNRVAFRDTGLFYDGIKEKTYCVSIDGDQIVEDTGCDIDIVITVDGIICFINDGSEQYCDLLDYLDLRDNDAATGIESMSSSLIAGGFR